MKNRDITPETVGVINPYALAEVALGHKVDWQATNVHEMLAKVFDMPYERLFDPKYGSPLYAGLEFNPTTLQMDRAAALVVGNGTPVMVSEPTKTDADHPMTDADYDPVPLGVNAVLAGVSASAVWADPGDFFEEGAEATDPVQGALGDCYFIAALSSVAWARTYEIAQRSRATGLAQTQFVDMVTFYDDNSNPIMTEVSELLPLNPPVNNFIYARSSESGEIWPAIYEKAYAKWRTKDAGDKPNYAPIAGGDPVRAAAELTGKKRFYQWTPNLSADEIWQKVRQNSISCKTFNPMVAWTYPSSDASPDKVNYNNANLVANHAYSILGWEYANNKKYVVLRNPWGSYEGSLGVMGGTWVAYDTPYYGGPGWWRPIQMATPDGIFALEVEVFKKYFSGFGWVAYLTF